MRRPRHLSPEERDLWDRVTRHDRRHAPARQKAEAEPSVLPAAKTVIEPPRPMLAPFRVGSQVDHRRDHDLLPALPLRLAQAPVQMDAATYRRMGRGKLKPEGRIDLHGMTLVEAHPALTGFILMAHAAQKRLVLVITGKGKGGDDFDPAPSRSGVLRRQVPQWLALPPLRSLVLQVTPAHISHGGAGALYVYLRRAR